ncbi:hypothetical protein BAU07_08245 [Bordetella flabilis]|uniref:Uncharacterized protein n=1 Tax=Bordetella flabilis TaxID=463014 RepID=A0A193GBU6_9BORD|nr:hypothetical protein BAU07_08245 [Bordetella flabilis]
MKERAILAATTLVGQWVRHPVFIDGFDALHNSISSGLRIAKLQERVIRDDSKEPARIRAAFLLSRDIGNCGHIARLERAAIHSPTINFTCAHPSLHPFMSARIVACPPKPALDVLLSTARHLTEDGDGAIELCWQPQR